MESTGQFTPQISDEAVAAKTGKNWAEWFAILDAAGAAQLSHPEIVAFLANEHQVGSWWQQMITVTYEQAFGLRHRYETAEGYQVSVSKTMPLPVGALYRAWESPESRSFWQPELADLSVTRATHQKTIRALWKDGKSRIDIAFLPKGEQKTQVTIQHNKLDSAEDVPGMRAYWAKVLQTLQEYLTK
ncbi:MAG TPA: DUF4287 domain-containing protein [Anaerolineaceae bacterium]|nr:DUF4287 domain-containing protein [Anaerolineaceae bacterium]